MIEPGDILTFAKELKSRFDADGYICTNLEVEYRNCARTSYYALFHALKEIADNIPGKYEDVASHEKVIRKLLSSSDQRINLLAQQMISIRKTRVRADYILDKSFGKNEATRSLEKVVRIFEKIDAGAYASALNP